MLHDVEHRLPQRIGCVCVPGNKIDQLSAVQHLGSDELFFTGTGAQVAPVRSVDRRLVGDGNPGVISKQLQDVYFEIVQGKNPKYRDWCAPVF